MSIYSGNVVFQLMTVFWMAGVRFMEVYFA
jgi:hypothetical protein